MRTYADRQRDLEGDRYTAPSDTRHHDPKTKTGARAIVGSPGGKKAAQFALVDLWNQAEEKGQGYLPTARIRAPLYVLEALETLGSIERATDDRGRAIRFRLTEAALAQIEAHRRPA